MKYVDRNGKRIAVDTFDPATPAKKRKPFEAQFVKLPAFWIVRLERSNSPGTFKLAHRILKEAFKRRYLGGELVLSTEATGLSRKVRYRAAKELVRLGLIEIEQNGNQAVRVTNLLFEREEEKKE
jgi:hypothetical protein